MRPELMSLESMFYRPDHGFSGGVHGVFAHHGPEEEHLRWEEVSNGLYLTRLLRQRTGLNPIPNIQPCIPTRPLNSPGRRRGQGVIWPWCLSGVGRVTQVVGRGGCPHGGSHLRRGAPGSGMRGVLTSIPGTGSWLFGGPAF